MPSSRENGIILDKSFLQASRAVDIIELARSNRLLVSDALFYELLTAPTNERTACFAKFPLGENPVDLVSHIGPLLRQEIETHRMCGSPSEHRVNLPFRFNPQLMHSDYTLPEEARNAIQEKTTELRDEVSRVLELAEDAPNRFPDVFSGSDVARKHARVDAERAIVSPAALNPILSVFDAPPGFAMPPSEIITEQWALYRWLQVRMLFAIDVRVRYGERGPPIEQISVYEKMEHDVLDAQLLMLGCLEGAFATREKKLIRWWNLLRPEGAIYQ